MTFSRDAAESWADIHWAVNAGLIEAPSLVIDMSSLRIRVNRLQIGPVHAKAGEPTNHTQGGGA